MKKTFKDLFKLATALATVAGIAYVARDQIKAIIDKVKEVSGDDIDDDFDEEEIFHEPTKDDRDYVSINITESNDSADEEDEAGETPSTEDEE